MSQINYDTLSKKTGTIYNALNKQHRWYTGLPIKAYVNKKIFRIKPDFGNSSINSGRWSAYCHYAAKSSLDNLLKKNNINKNSTVVIHPLISNDLVSQLQKTGCRIQAIDIDKDNLNLDTHQLQNYIINQPKPDLILNTAPAGIYKDLLNHLDIFNQKSINSITIVNNSTITAGLLELFEKINFGGAIFNGGGSFVDDHLNEVLDSPVPDKSWYFSFQIEHRTQSILEYHLKESHEVFGDIVEAYYYLLLGKRKNILNKVLPSLARNTILKNNFNNADDAKKMIATNMASVYQKAVPDIFFELENIDPKYNNNLNHQSLVELDSFLYHKNNELHSFMIDQTKRLPSGSIEVPKLFTNRTYLNFFFYTTDHQFWNDYFTGLNINYQKGQPLPDSISKIQLPNAQFASSYLAQLDIIQILHKRLKFNA